MKKMVLFFLLGALAIQNNLQAMDPMEIEEMETPSQPPLNNLEEFIAESEGGKLKFYVSNLKIDFRGVMTFRPEDVLSEEGMGRFLLVCSYEDRIDSNGSRVRIDCLDRPEGEYPEKPYRQACLKYFLERIFPQIKTKKIILDDNASSDMKDHFSIPEIKTCFSQYGFIEGISSEGNPGRYWIKTEEGEKTN